MTGLPPPHFPPATEGGIDNLLILAAMSARRFLDTEAKEVGGLGSDDEEDRRDRHDDDDGMGVDGEEVSFARRPRVPARAAPRPRRESRPIFRV